jgi:uncharacterized membrane protein YedE/YeeE
MVPVSNAALIVGGLIVGVGVTFGGGCTSGHGISGNARLSVRSMAYTGTFMAAGFITASLLESATHVQTVHAATPPIELMLRAAVRLLAAHVGAYAALAMLGRTRALAPSLALDLLSFVDGSLFACGLGLSGMTSAARVAQFLDISAGRWNPTLMFVMAGGLALTAPFMLALVLSKRLRKPVLGDKFEIPTSKVIDRRLLLGGVLFGTGWGVGGMCPGPALVNVASPHGAPLLYLVAMFAGLKLTDSRSLLGALGCSC